MLENNDRMNNALSKLDVVPSRRYRVYEMELLSLIILIVLTSLTGK